MTRREHGFTLIELMIVVAIIGILASLAISAYQTYVVRTQISEGISFAGSAKVPIVDAYTNDGEPPATRLEAGLSGNPADNSGAYVQQVDIANGRIDITFGNQAHADIQGDRLSLTPYITPGSVVLWRCGSAPAPGGGAVLLGTGTATEAAYLAPTVDQRYLPQNCR